MVKRAAPPVPPLLRSQVKSASSGMGLSVPVEHSTKALVMSTPVSAIWVGVALFGRAATPLVTLSTIAAWADVGASQAATTIASRASTPRAWCLPHHSRLGKRLGADMHHASHPCSARVFTT